jgi:hypothetical protein
MEKMNRDVGRKRMGISQSISTRIRTTEKNISFTVNWKLHQLKDQ